MGTFDEQPWGDSASAINSSVDEYVFTVPEGGSRVVIDYLGGLTYNYGSWSVLDAGGETVRSGSFNTTAGQRFDQVLTAGQYRFRVVPLYERTGTYSLRVARGG